MNKKTAPVTTYDKELAHTYFIEQLILAMQQAGLSEPDVARLIGKSEAHLKKLFAGKNLDFGQAVELAQAVGLHFVPRIRSKTQRLRDLKSH